MSAKQKNITMKNLLLPSFLMLFLTSCLTTAHINYSDPNYLGKDEFSTYDEIIVNNQIDNEEISADTINNYYETDDYYEYSFSSRRRIFGP